MITPDCRFLESSIRGRRLRPMSATESGFTNAAALDRHQDVRSDGFRGRGTVFGNRTCCGRVVSAPSGRGCCAVAQRHTHPPGDRNLLRACAGSRECGGALVASERTRLVFHGLAVASLVTIAFGLSPLLLGNRSPVFIATHAHCMTWSYAGLVAAGCGQLAVALSEDGAAWVVPLVIGTVLSVSGVVIFGKCRRSSMACWLKQLPTDPRLRVKRARRYSVLAGSTASPVGFSAGRT